MRLDHVIPVRTAVIEALKLTPSIAALVGDAVYIEEAPPEPTWPFIAWGEPDESPFTVTGGDGSSLTLTLHAFARGPGSDATRRLARLIVARLDYDDRVPDLILRIEADELAPGEGPPPVPRLIELRHVRTTVVRDTDVAGAYHGVIEFAGTTVAP